MGGNALKEYHPQRMSTRDVVNTFNHIQRLWVAHSEQPLYLVPWVDEKDDHGDIDIVVDSYVEYVQEWLNGRVQIMKRNDKVLSVGWPVDDHIVQVDFICTERQYPVTMRFFYSGGDFGMLLGRLAAWQGLVFGMDGLRLRANPAEPWSKDILLTADPEGILEAMALPAAVPRFTTYEVLWSYVMRSSWAKSYMFMPEATNAENRSRDKQRPQIKAFQDWLKKNHPLERGKSVRATFSDALNWARLRYGNRVLDERIQQEVTWNKERSFRAAVGLGAVEVISAEPLTQKIAGTIVRDMQAYLPPKESLRGLQADILETLAQNAARVCLLQRGLPVKPGVK